MKKKGPVVLMILDGWGYKEQSEHNAIAQADKPQWDAWWNTYPHILLDASGHSVGLPDAQMGNSEVGHMHIGAGRIVQQDFTRINEAIATHRLSENPNLCAVANQLKQTDHALHIMGLLSPGGVHSHEDHLFALLDFCSQQQLTVCLHLFLDGRDTPPQSALASIAKLNQHLEHHPRCRIVSLCGRYYAMDRDERWERIEPVYDLLTQGHSQYSFAKAEEAILSFYQQQVTDEFIPPSQIGAPSPIETGDALLFFNFRADRARQLSAAFIAPEFSGFKKKIVPQLSSFISMTCYDQQLAATLLFPPLSMTNTVGEVIAQHGLKQLRLAETEKYAHVTFFLNGGQERTFNHEERILVPSPKVATYDLQPEMSAPLLTRLLIKAIQEQTYDVIICNYANADMVGHTGDFDATLKAIHCLDTCMQQVGEALAAVEGMLLITADHGNAETMYDETTHQAHTAHTTDPVPLLFIGKGYHFIQKQGTLIDIAPTLLHLLDIAQPKEMTGRILLEKDYAPSC
ncbi:MAG: phosphoglycerate mutase (2,3-diphosphoglycerate-independent) [Legionella sp.]|nr:MAG: phosphoglycerate mutase (2,3-diphosphoglycerate-independent) [Legionella sp.]PJD98086.1 MAG: phosphoglycerate mutase (2,3-diphosphoglycerate-independent) [Legionella sp.]